MNIPLKWWTNTSTHRKRLLSIIAVFVVSIIVVALGTTVPIDANEADQISEDLNQTVDLMSQQGALLQYIFGNNLFICLLMFIPLIGPFIGIFILFNTGTVLEAVATSMGIPPLLAFVLTFIPIGIIEFMAYSIGMAQSVWLFWRSITRRGLRELRVTCIFITICAVVLLLGAIAETSLIGFAG